jgi:hypothetical protein
MAAQLVARRPRSSRDAHETSSHPMRVTAAQRGLGGLFGPWAEHRPLSRPNHPLRRPAVSGPLIANVVMTLCGIDPE